MTAIAIIPARGGSRRIEKKNIKDFLGKPIIAYSIETAKKSRLFDDIVVSTDDEEIVEVAKYHGANIHYRDPAFARDEVGTQEVMAHVLEDLKNTWERVWGWACCIYPTAPLMLPQDVFKGRELLTRLLPSDPWSPDYVVSVGTAPLRDAGQWYWGYANSFITHAPLYIIPTMLFPLPEERICDINTMDDWAEAERKYLALHPERASDE